MNTTRSLQIGLALATFATAAWTYAQKPLPMAQPKGVQAKIAEVEFIGGDWETAGDKVRSQERWTHAEAGTMLGTGRTIGGGRTVFFEFLRLEERDGGIDYVAHPGGGAGTAFRLTKIEARKAVFENPSHDFPKKITYTLEDGGVLVARIEGDGTEKESPQEFRFAPRAKK